MAGRKENTRTYQPINAYGVIGDCHSVVLVAADGSIDWGCLPDFDSPAIFCRLLDAEQGGYFQIAPSEGTIPGAQSYLPGSNVLQTRFTSIQGELVLTDFMPVESLRAWPYESTKGTSWGCEDGFCHCLVRRIECIRGAMAVTMALKVSPEYASVSSEANLLPHVMGAVISGGDQHVGLAIMGAGGIPSFSFRLEPDEKHPSIIAEMTLQPGEHLLFVLGMGRTARAA